ncbi:hypothetical protein RBI22_07765 [Alcaligenaceae bacterium C4P045]|nr:hypothetical protein [Alcaligenaceae bacterium C4P045]
MASPRFSGTSLPPIRRSSLLLASAGARVGGAVILAAALWALTGWALGWWTA